MTFENSARLCVYGKTTPTSSWISQLSKTLPNSPIGISLLGECVKAQDAPSQWQKFADSATNGDFHQAVIACAQLFPGENFILLRSDTHLPVYWYERLIRALDDQTILAAGALDNLDSTRSPLKEEANNTADPAAIDSLCFAYGRHAVIDCAILSPLLSAWNGKYLQNANLKNLPSDFLALSSTSHRMVMLDHLYVTTTAQLLTRKNQTPTAYKTPNSSALAELRELVCSAAISKSKLIPKKAFFGLDTKPVLLHILHGWGGGAERFVRDFANSDNAYHHLVLIARGHHSRKYYGETLELYFGSLAGPPLRQLSLPNPIADTAIHNFPYAQFLTEIKRDYCIDVIIVSSLIGHSLDVFRTDLPSFIITHDFYPLWPVLHKDFGNPKFTFDDTQLSRDLTEAEHDFEFSGTDPAYWKRLRRAYVTAVIEAKTTFIAPSYSAFSNLLRIEPKFQQLARQMIPHGFAPWATQINLPLPVSTPGQRLRVLIPGRIRKGKGAELLKPVLPYLRQYADIFLLGCGVEGHDFFGENNVHIIVNYQREELPQQVSILNPDVALLLPTVAETFSYVLSEIWSLELPVIATRVGSLAERIEHGITGWLAEPSPAAIEAAIAQIVRDPKKLIQIRKEIKQRPPKSLSAMVREYHELLSLKSKPIARYPLHTITTDQLALASLSKNLEDAKQRILKLESEIDTQIEELAARADWARGLEGEAHAKTSWAKELEQDLNKALNTLLKTETELENRTQWALSLNEEISQLGKQIIDLNEEISRQSKQIIDLNALIDELRKAQEIIAEEKQSLTQEKQLLLSSRSWRITAPLRHTTTLYRNLRVKAHFSFLRYRSMLGRLRGSVARRGTWGTFQRLMAEFSSPKLSTTDKFVSPISAPHSPDNYPLPFALPTSSTPKVSIIIPVYNKFSYTYACLRSLSEHAGEIHFEVIVIDDFSSDETAESLSKISGLEWFRNSENLGFIRSCNAGAEKSKGEFIVFLNNDTVVTAGWLEALIECIETEPNAGLVGAKLVYPDGRLQEAGGIVFNDGSGWNYGRFDDPNHPKYNYRREVDYCSGAAILLRRELFEQLGGFDTRYTPAYYEDTDLAFSVRARGLKVIYEPTSVVIHFEGITSGKDTSTGIKSYQIINQEKFLKKWKDALLRQPISGSEIDIAREHRTEGRILIIDSYMPTPDQDAGSLRMINFIRILRRLGYAISFLPENLAYMPNYTAVLQALGVEALYHPYIDPVRWFRENGKLLKAIILSRHYVAANFIGLCKLYAPQARLLFDTVDLHYLREQRAAELENRTDLKRQAEITRANELKIMQECDLTLVVSPVEQTLLKQELPQIRVEILSTVHEVYGCRKSFSERADLLFIGGFQHTPNVDAMLFFTNQIWPLIRAKLPEVKLHIVGSKSPAEILALNGHGIIVHGFVEDIAPLMDSCRISIAPLRYGAGVKGKVNMAMSYGLPVVATSIAVEGMYIQPNEDVMVADTPTDYAAAIVQMYQDENLWNKLSENGLENVRRFFSFDAASEAVKRILK